jgi:hypothetical protein
MKAFGNDNLQQPGRHAVFIKKSGLLYFMCNFGEGQNEKKESEMSQNFF